MKNRIIILCTFACLFTGGIYGCSSPPAHAPTSVDQKDRLCNQLGVMPTAFAAYDLYQGELTSVPAATTSYLQATGSAITAKNVSMTAYGHAIRQCVATDLNINHTYTTQLKVTGSPHIQIHIDPGLLS